MINVISTTRNWVKGYRDLMSLSPGQAATLATLVFIDCKCNHESRALIEAASNEARHLYGDRLKGELSQKWGNELDVLRRYDSHLDQVLREKRNRVCLRQACMKSSLRPGYRGCARDIAGSSCGESDDGEEHNRLARAAGGRCAAL